MFEGFFSFFFKNFGHFIPFEVPGTLAHFFAHRGEDMCPGIIGFVNRMSQSHDFSAGIEQMVDIRFNLVDGADFKKHLHDPGICTAVQISG